MNTVPLIRVCAIVLALVPAAFGATRNITTYGANGSDGSDDTTAVQQAVTAAANEYGAVYVPAGTYYISDAITNSSQNGLTIYGDGDSSVVRLIHWNSDFSCGSPPTTNSALKIL